MASSQRSFTFLGTGTSVGVPQVGCDCHVCQSSNPRNQRYRCSVVIGTAAGNILIDTTPELRLQLVRAKIKVVHAVLYTHYHVDHLYGLDDLRPLQFILGGPVPIYCTTEVERRIRQAFGYAFGLEAEAVNSGYLPRLAVRTIDEQPFEVLGQHVTPIPLIHNHFNVLGFRLGNVAYCTDVSKIPRESWPLLEGLDVLILDALRPRPHPAHFSLDQAVEAIQRIQPKQAYLTHMSHELEHEATNRQLPPNIELAYDGLSFPF